MSNLLSLSMTACGNWSRRALGYADLFDEPVLDSHDSAP
jgi:hypothetical protein